MIRDPSDGSVNYDNRMMEMEQLEILRARNEMADEQRMAYKLDSISDEEAKRHRERREGESMTAFTMRRIRNEHIEQCAKVAADHNGISPKDSRDIAGKIRNLIEKGQ